MIIYYAELKVKTGLREAYVQKLQEAKLEELFRGQHGNIFYSISESTTDPDKVVVCDAWESKSDFDAHVSSEDCKTWFSLYDEYVEESLIGNTYQAELVQ